MQATRELSRTFRLFNYIRGGGDGENMTIRRKTRDLTRPANDNKWVT